MPRRLLRSAVYRFLTLVLSVVLLSVAVAAIPGGMGVIAQQPATTSQDAKRAAATLAFSEGEQLMKQNTAASRRHAIEKFVEALAVFRSVSSHASVATTLYNIGGVYSDLGENQLALNYLNQALPLSRAVGNKTEEALTLSTIGKVYSDLGENKLALDYYNQALPLSRAVGDKIGEARTLNNIGAAYYASGAKQKALDYYNQALPLSQAVGDKTGSAATGDKAGEAAILSNIGAVYAALGEKKKGIDYLNQALPLARGVGASEFEASTLNNIASLQSERGTLQLALAQIKVRTDARLYQNPNTAILPPDFNVYTIGNSVVNSYFPGTEKKTLPTVNEFIGAPGCYVACYSHSQKNSVYSVGGDIYVMGQVRVPGKYQNRICLPRGEERKDISAEPKFKELCARTLPNACTGNSCWTGGDTGGWFAIP